MTTNETERFCDHCRKEMNWDTLLFVISVPTVDPDRYVHWHYLELCFSCLEDLSKEIRPWLQTSKSPESSSD